MKELKIIDFHCDTASLIYYHQADLHTNSYHVDLEKMKKANYLAQWFAFFVDIQSLDKEETPYQVFKQMYAYFMAQISQNAECIEVVTDYKGYQACKAQNKLAAFLSLEEGQIIEGKLDNLEDAIAKGSRLMTFTWNYANDLGYPHHQNQGLTPLGKSVATYLNTTPVLLDISHLSESALVDLREYYHKPIIASHSNARSFYQHTRNVSDEGIRLIAESGGVIGTNFYSHFLRDGDLTLIEDLVQNIQRVYKIGGADILALGTDFDGIECQLEVCNCSQMDKLITRLLKSFPSSIVDKITYKNAERLIKENL